MNILITGTAGFIGRLLCDKLIADGYQVRGAARGSVQLTALPSGVEGVLVGNIGPETNWHKALDGIDVVIHLAARVHVMDDLADNPLAEFRKVNTVGTLNLARQAVVAGVRRFVYLSSVKVNGESPGNRCRDHGSGVRGQENTDIRGQEDELKEAFSEKDAPEPQGPYAVSKWEAEQVLKEIADETGLEVVILRPPLVYGPDVKANFLRLLKLVGQGIPLPLASVYNRRSLIYLGNIVDAIVACIAHPKAAGQTYLVSDGEDVTTPELVRRIADALGRPARLFPLPTIILRFAGKFFGRKDIVERLLGSLIIDSAKIRNELNWHPPFTMQQGLREMAQWYLKRDEGQKSIRE